MSTSLWRMTWCWISGLPKVWRSLACASASSYFGEADGGKAEPFVVERHGDTAECRAFCTDQMLGRHPAIVELQHRRVGGPPSHLAQRRSRQAGRRAFDQEQRNAAAAGAAGAHGDRQIVGAHARGDEGLFPVDDEVITVPARARAQISHVRSRARLGHGKRRNLFSGQHRRNDFTLERLRPELDDRREPDRMTHQRRAHPSGAAARQLLAEDDRIEPVGGNPAQFLGVIELQQAHLGGLAVKLARKGPRLVPLVDMRFDLSTHKAADLVAERLMRGVVKGRMQYHPSLPVRSLGRTLA